MKGLIYSSVSRSPGLSPLTGGKQAGHGPLSDFERYLDWDEVSVVTHLFVAVMLTFKMAAF